MKTIDKDNINNKKFKDNINNKKVKDNINNKKVKDNINNKKVKDNINNKKVKDIINNKRNNNNNNNKYSNKRDNKTKVKITFTTTAEIATSANRHVIQDDKQQIRLDTRINKVTEKMSISDNKKFAFETLEPEI
ncbi:hypothetical protein HELRODRAFT_183391 [Helobdella robusta]|uniref:Uncharacterized protein n=1 Tax=Helobdella robusta TaxID=6412 RepID=T1FJK1_HELRO|nr:hypothetical protein HELRODRAFT_183391 [Helobdella robusta]ESO11216.1 hypothetical protein HELRODRAFT_183391 [Helobdella robusta]